MPSPPSGWPWPDGYSPSTQAALRFAWAAAAVRQGHASPSSSTLFDLDDLLIGTLLSHPGSSEPELCFRHFGLVAGQVIDDGYPRLTADSVNRQLDTLTSRDMPASGGDVAVALDLAVSRARQAKDERVHLAFIWYGLLGVSQSATASRLQRAFETRGTELSYVYVATERWLDGGEKEPYADWLKKTFPDPQAPTSVVSFKADTTIGASTASGDLLQIGREVDAFAYLLAAKDTRPPLAIGLFGAWGSGKTFFMESVRRRIDTLLQEKAVTEQPQGLTPFWKRVIPIEFNAWHYAEGDLLASLIDHIFTELRRETYGRSPDPAKAEEEGWLQRLDENQQKLHTKRSALATAETDLSSLEAAQAALESQRDEALRTLDDRVAARAIEQSLTIVVKALKEATGRTTVAADLTIGDAGRQLDEVRKEGLRVLGLLRWLGGSSLRSVLTLLAVAAVPFLVAWIENISSSGSTAAFGGGAAVALETLVVYTAFARRHLDSLDKARVALEHEAASIRAEHEKVIESKANEVRSTQDKVSAKRTAVEKLESPDIKVGRSQRTGSTCAVSPAHLSSSNNHRLNTLRRLLAAAEQAPQPERGLRRRPSTEARKYESPDIKVGRSQRTGSTCAVSPAHLSSSNNHRLNTLRRLLAAAEQAPQPERGLRRRPSTEARKYCSGRSQKNP